jgi:GNAT superfamily N-acetyltransferase
MADAVELLDAARGRLAPRAERPADEALLYALFRSMALQDLAGISADDAAREALVGMQFVLQTAYRYPQARFDILEQDDLPVGRLVVDNEPQVFCFIDYVLLPERRASGLGRAIIAALLEHLARTGKPAQVKALCTNEPSLRMCRRFSFVQIDAAPPYLHCNGARLAARANRCAARI